MQKEEIEKDFNDFLNQQIKDLLKQGKIKTDDISDGYHTFGELYKHRIHLFIALCKQIQIIDYYNLGDNTWDKTYKKSIIKSKKHYDGSEWKGWFIIQLQTSYGQISYHLPNEYWDKCDFIETMRRAKFWDGHTSDDVLERLLLI